MIRLLLICAVLIGALLLIGQRRATGVLDNSTLPQGSNENERKILAVIEEMLREKKTYLSVPVADGRMMRVLTEGAGAKHVVEIGTSTGFSGLWFSLALLGTGGKLTTFEMDAGRAAMAKKHFQQAGVDRLITIVEGNAHEKITDLKGPIDVVFIDADKEGYVDYLNKLLPLVRPGGLILAHNITMAAVQEGYMKEVMANPNLATVNYLDGGGMSVTVKKR